MNHKSKKGSQFSKAPKAGLNLALDILKDVYELWLETATVASIQAYIQKHGISPLNHDQFELEFQRLHTASTNTECDLSVDLASVKKRCFELLEHPDRPQSQIKPLEDGIARFEVASIGTGKPLSKKLEIAKVVDKKKEFEKDLRQNANFYIHFTKNLWNR